MQRSALCRPRRELSNEYLLATFGFDTAENEPYQVRADEQAERAHEAHGRLRRRRAVPGLFTRKKQRKEGGVDHLSAVLPTQLCRDVF